MGCCVLDFYRMTIFNLIYTSCEWHCTLLQAVLLDLNLSSDPQSLAENLVRAINAYLVILDGILPRNTSSEWLVVEYKVDLWNHWENLDAD